MWVLVHDFEAERAHEREFVRDRSNQKWSVNWKFLPSYCFHSSAFVVSLLVLHLLCLVYLASSRWLSHRSRFYEALRTWRWKDATYLPPGHVLTILLTSNFAGMAQIRSSYLADPSMPFTKVR